MSNLSLNRREVLKTTGIGIGGSVFGLSVATSPAVGQNVTEIQDWYDLDAVREDLSGDYVLVDDLDENAAGYDDVVTGRTVSEFTEFVQLFSGNSDAELTHTPVDEIVATTFDAELTVVDAENGIVEVDDDAMPVTGEVTYTTADEQTLGFDPIGEFRSSFTGTFDGQQNVITGLRIDRPLESGVGLFRSSRRPFGGTPGEDGSISNLGLEDVKITGDRNVGPLLGDLFSLATIEKCYATGEVIGDTHVGGLVGRNQGTITECYANSEITGDYMVGGLVGNNDREIEKSYAESTVKGGSNVGGLVGNNPETVAGSHATVDECYATGEVTGRGNVGGLIGDSGLSAGGSYWDRETTGKGSSAGLPDENGLTTAEMTGEDAADQMEAFDFDGTWEIVTGPAEYPRLQWQDDEPPKEHESGVDQEVFDAVDQDGDGDITLEELVEANLERLGDPNNEVNGVEVTLEALVKLNLWRVTG